MAIKIILVGFILFILIGVFRRYRKQELTLKELLLWTLLWAFVIIAVLIPQTTDFLASTVGVGRGLDLVLVISVITIFYILFRVLSRLERIEKDVSTVVRTTAIHNAKAKTKFE